MPTPTMTALKTELDTDPAGLGYTGKGPRATANLINSEKAGVTFTVREVPVQQVVEAVNLSEYSALTGPQKNQLDLVLRPDMVDIVGNAKFNDLFAPATITKQAIVAMQSRTGSRAEELWGEGTSITPKQVRVARSLA